MAKDYFQDIIPPQGAKRVPITNTTSRPEPIVPKPEVEETDDDIIDPPEAPERSIRNISAPVRQPQRTFADTREVPPGLGTNRPERRSRVWMWVIAAIALAVLGILLSLALRPTTITVTPRTHTVVFDQTATYTAYPAETGAEGTLVYTVETLDVEDSEVVPSTGTVQASDKASGTITVYNNYSTDPVRLIKETRFQTPAGLIFRTPAEVMIPGKTAAGAGKVDITVIADQPGEQYNVGPTDKFTLPGLQSSADMFKGVYGQSTAAMTGGFVGSRPGVSESDTANAVAQVRARLEQKVRDAVAALNTDEKTALAALASITYQEMPNTTEAGGSVRIHQNAHTLVPVFVSTSFARSIARTVSADADVASIELRPKEGFMAHAVATSTLGAEPLQFTMSGQAQLVWGIDETELTQALAGKNKDAFQSIVTGFPGVEEARARIQPFWSSTFPTDPTKIKVKIEESAE